MQMNYKKDGKFEKLFPKTLSGNVMFNNGQTIEEWKMEIDNYINKTEDKFEELWSGNDLVTANSSIIPSKKLTECNNGWLLVFKNSSSVNNFSYHYIPKIHLTLPRNLLLDGVKLLTGSAGGVIAHKYIFIEDNSIKGHSSNETGDNSKTELYKIYEY
ncbi:hypothetical protein K0O13_07645 [Mammaliicoccus sciuri]|uniref:hypothetical protein n=1 Tax=Mammaliicoccus sciuri TaxID=1296 RepID=UPI001C63791A|nr:hypothetical protein [Mammaliicoccus sciuri]QYG29974.1 hypothetical protein K0O13_07645 [Mammaliicoccus sciuri]